MDVYLVVSGKLLEGGTMPLCVCVCVCVYVYVCVCLSRVVVMAFSLKAKFLAFPPRGSETF